MTRRIPSGKSVTLRDVADRVGITPAAVSMALAGSTRISARTRASVQEAAADLGYVGSSAARALRKQQAGAIALIVPTTATHVFGHSYFMHILSGVSTSANERDVQLLISTSNDESNGVAAYERVMRSKSADGAILTSAAIVDPTIGRLASSGFPMVLIGNYPEIPSAVTVGIDDFRASGFVTDHLIEVHGRSRLLHVAGPLDHQTGIDRRDGFLDSLERHGMSSDGFVVEGDFSEASGFAAISDLSLHDRTFDGMVFANDDMAFGGLQALELQRIEVPRDVSIVGFDDFGLSRVTTPGISTVHVPAEYMARLAADRLFQLIAGEVGGWTRKEVGVSFVPRRSCGCEEPAPRLATPGPRSTEAPTASVPITP
ncbi:LacI family DNA-binding transcriptional regulator [Cellulomonas sp. KRMCY2]|uniref:LacI family DNA-binding transcriptional regulator n=1 Tax=Cellulomonas sp. KRMCY2 TaxID=1304865 RepID=UPI00045EBEE5|nr:LacI family DNA-binding transcriptional regulator [Cellulomonas sp. KRMCY2]